MSANILGVLIARVSGRSLSAFMRERIFEPLGMSDTGFTVAEAQLDRVATCYKTDFSTGEITVLEEARSDLLTHPCVFESGAGDQFVSTADDLFAFGRMMLNRGAYGKEQILSRLSVELMTTDQLTAAQKAASPFFENFWDSRGWGLGVSIVTRRDGVAGVPDASAGTVLSAPRRTSTRGSTWSASSWRNAVPARCVCRRSCSISGRRPTKRSTAERARSRRRTCPGWR